MLRVSETELEVLSSSLLVEFHSCRATITYMHPNGHTKFWNTQKSSKIFSTAGTYKELWCISNLFLPRLRSPNPSEKNKGKIITILPLSSLSLQQARVRRIKLFERYVIRMSHKEEACRLQVPHVVKERVLSNFRRNIDKVTTFRLTREQMSGKDRASDPSIRRSSACSILAVQSAT